MGRFRTIAVYIMTDRRYGVLYTGVTAYFIDRVSRHRVGEGSQFTARYRCKHLVWYEVHQDIRTAIQREKSIKRYPRQWKVNLIEAQNPGWNDLWSQIVLQPLPGRRLSVEAFRRGERLDPEDS